jgi:hypothetical protein
VIAAFLAYKAAVFDVYDKILEVVAVVYFFKQMFVENNKTAKSVFIKVS